MTKHPDALRRQIEASRERVSRLCGAVLRISASLDIDAVLQEVVDSARALTDARYGVITTVDEAGRPRQFLSSGFTREEHRQMGEWADGLQLFEHLRERRGALRIGDLSAYVRSLGLSADMLMGKTLEGTPIHHRGVHVGSLFVSEKEGAREFTSEDEQVLVLLASQAATAIANARAYRDERRARANLEALVDTSPVVTLAGRPVALTATEYELLRVLSANAGRVVNYRALLRQAWGRYKGSVDPKLVHAVVTRLRRKLGDDPARAAYILNERRVGYRMPAQGGK